MAIDQRTQSHQFWITATKWLFLCIAIIVIAIVAVPKTINSILEGTGKASAAVISTSIEAAGKAVSEFTATKVQNVFEQRVLASKMENNLHVATFQGILSIRKSEESGWTHATVEVRKPAEVPLYVPLKKNVWSFEITDGTLLVLSPAIEYGRTSLDNARVERVIHDRSWRISEARMLEDAERELDEQMQQRGWREAKGERNKAREGVAQFIRDWVLKPAFPNHSDAQITVVFPDEALPDKR